MPSLTLEEFSGQILEIMPVIMRELITKQQDELLKGKITPAQFVILNFLSKKGESKMKNLAVLLNVTTAAMTGIVDKLFKSGYVKRVYDPKDRRVIKISLTNKGRDLTNKINQQRKTMIIKIFSQLSRQEREDYLKILMRIRHILVQSDKNSAK
ncbi:MAG: hypothetical protein DRP74_00760 [Candidatus Omnitrophota bacterium]|nr:MAG: hypothetical protein DRP74_00760 [Candidatus Omnitrophota bacterium]